MVTQKKMQEMVEDMNEKLSELLNPTCLLPFRSPTEIKRRVTLFGSIQSVETFGVRLAIFHHHTFLGENRPNVIKNRINALENRLVRKDLGYVRRVYSRYSDDDIYWHPKKHDLFTACRLRLDPDQAMDIEDTIFEPKFLLKRDVSRFNSRVYTLLKLIWCTSLKESTALHPYGQRIHKDNYIQAISKIVHALFPDTSMHICIQTATRYWLTDSQTITHVIEEVASGSKNLHDHSIEFVSFTFFSSRLLLLLAPYVADGNEVGYIRCFERLFERCLIIDRHDIITGNDVEEEEDDILSVNSEYFYHIADKYCFRDYEEISTACFIDPLVDIRTNRFLISINSSSSSNSTASILKIEKAIPLPKNMENERHNSEFEFQLEVDTGKEGHIIETDKLPVFQNPYMNNASGQEGTFARRNSIVEEPEDLAGDEDDDETNDENNQIDISLQGALAKELGEESDSEEEFTHQQDEEEEEEEGTLISSRTPSVVSLGDSLSVYELLPDSMLKPWEAHKPSSLLPPPSYHSKRDMNDNDDDDNTNQEIDDSKVKPTRGPPVKMGSFRRSFSLTEQNHRSQLHEIESAIQNAKDSCENEERVGDGNLEGGTITNNNNTPSEFLVIPSPMGKGRMRKSISLQEANQIKELYAESPISNDLPSFNRTSSYSSSYSPSRFPAAQTFSTSVALPKSSTFTASTTKTSPPSHHQHIGSSQRSQDSSHKTFGFDSGGGGGSSTNILKSISELKHAEFKAGQRLVILYEYEKHSHKKKKTLKKSNLVDGNENNDNKNDDDDNNVDDDDDSDDDDGSVSIDDEDEDEPMVLIKPGELAVAIPGLGGLMTNSCDSTIQSNETLTQVQEGEGTALMKDKKCFVRMDSGACGFVPLTYLLPVVAKKVFMDDNVEEGENKLQEQNHKKVDILIKDTLEVEHDVESTQLFTKQKRFSLNSEERKSQYEKAKHFFANGEPVHYIHNSGQILNAFVLLPGVGFPPKLIKLLKPKDLKRLIRQNNHHHHHPLSQSINFERKRISQRTSTETKYEEYENNNSNSYIAQATNPFSHSFPISSEHLLEENNENLDDNNLNENRFENDGNSTSSTMSQYYHFPNESNVQVDYLEMKHKENPLTIQTQHASPLNHSSSSSSSSPCKKHHVTTQQIIFKDEDNELLVSAQAVREITNHEIEETDPSSIKLNILCKAPPCPDYHEELFSSYNLPNSRFIKNVKYHEDDPLNNAGNIRTQIAKLCHLTREATLAASIMNEPDGQEIEACRALTRPQTTPVTIPTTSSSIQNTDRYGSTSSSAHVSAHNAVRPRTSPSQFISTTKQSTTQLKLNQFQNHHHHQRQFSSTKSEHELVRETLRRTHADIGRKWSMHGTTHWQTQHSPLHLSPNTLNKQIKPLTSSSPLSQVSSSSLSNQNQLTFENKNQNNLKQKQNHNFIQASYLTSISSQVNLSDPKHSNVFDRRDKNYKFSPLSIREINIIKNRIPQTKHSDGNGNEVSDSVQNVSTVLSDPNSAPHETKHSSSNISSRSNSVQLPQLLLTSDLDSTISSSSSSSSSALAVNNGGSSSNQNSYRRPHTPISSSRKQSLKIEKELKNQTHETTNNEEMISPWEGIDIIPASSSSSTQNGPEETPPITPKPPGKFSSKFLNGSFDTALSYSPRKVPSSSSSSSTTSSLPSPCHLSGENENVSLNNDNVVNSVFLEIVKDRNSIQSNENTIINNNNSNKKKSSTNKLLKTTLNSIVVDDDDQNDDDDSFLELEMQQTKEEEELLSQDKQNNSILSDAEQSEHFQKQQKQSSSSFEQTSLHDHSNVSSEYINSETYAAVYLSQDSKNELLNHSSTHIPTISDSYDNDNNIKFINNNNNNNIVKQFKHFNKNIINVNDDGILNNSSITMEQFTNENNSNSPAIKNNSFKGKSLSLKSTWSPRRKNNQIISSFSPTISSSSSSSSSLLNNQGTLRRRRSSLLTPWNQEDDEEEEEIKDNDDTHNKQTNSHYQLKKTIHVNQHRPSTAPAPNTNFYNKNITHIYSSRPTTPLPLSTSTSILKSQDQKYNINDKINNQDFILNTSQTVLIKNNKNNLSSNKHKLANIVSTNFTAQAPSAVRNHNGVGLFEHRIRCDSVKMIHSLMKNNQNLLKNNDIQTDLIHSPESSTLSSTPLTSPIHTKHQNMNHQQIKYRAPIIQGPLNQHQIKAKKKFVPKPILPKEFTHSFQVRPTTS